MHEPTPPARRVAALRYQAEQLLRDAAAWGYELEILAPGRRTGNEQAVNLRPIPHDDQPSARVPAPSPAAPER